MHVVDIGNREFPTEQQFDLIISLISWGFHYSIDTYLDETAASLAKGGVMLLDIRKDSDSIDILKTRFGSVEIVETAHKWSGAWQKVRVCH